MTDKLTADRLRELMHYSPETGVFTRRIRSGRYQPGELAGTPHSRGYWALGIGGKNYKAHRAAWLYMHGSWPDGEIDHVNRDKRDNRISNLRVVTRVENTNNRVRARVDNKLGLLGVSQVGSRFIARIVLDGEQKYLGIYRTPQEASAAYTSAKHGAQT